MYTHRVEYLFDKLRLCLGCLAISIKYDCYYKWAH
jgi:hypothetical protein